MQGLIRCAVVAGMLLGCGPGGIGPQDDTQDPKDAPPGPAGLIVEWSSAPSIPSPAGTVTIEKARFIMASLRVVGDAGPGDPRTTQNNMVLGFAWSSPEQQPTAITFNDAPTGRYSQVALSFDGGTNEAYEIRGQVTVGSNDIEYRIEDDKPLAFNVPIDTMVMPGEMATVKLKINFTAALSVIDFPNLDMSDGRYELQDGDAQMPMFRTKLIESFEVISPI
jgi:hypothetical protein